MEDTEKFAYELAQKAEPGQVYALIGDLGVGKTVFTKGFARGLGIEEPVNSPTFTILQIYEEGRIPLTTLMYTGSRSRRKWRKWASTIMCTETGYA